MIILEVESLRSGFNTDPSSGGDPLALWTEHSLRASAESERPRHQTWCRAGTPWSGKFLYKLISLMTQEFHWSSLNAFWRHPHTPWSKDFLPNSCFYTWQWERRSETTNPWVENCSNWRSTLIQMNHKCLQIGINKMWLWKYKNSSSTGKR